MPKANQRSEASPEVAKDKSVERANRSIDRALMQFGQQLRALRKTSGVTQKEIESRSGLTQGGISKFESRGNGDLRTLIQYALGMRTKPSDLIGLLDGCVESHGVTLLTLGDVPVLVEKSVGAELVQKLADELESRSARPSKSRGKAGRSGA